jgi:phage terminase Nu1 subunit (DNA packaging protein)
MGGCEVIASIYQPVTQAAFGEMVGVTQQAISTYVTSGLLKPGDTAHAWLLAYCDRLRMEASGRASPVSDDLNRERTALARSQREAQDLKNAVTRGEYAPIGLLEDVLAIASSAVADRIEGLEGLLRKVAPDLPEPTRDALLVAIAGARNEWVRATTRLVLERLDAIDADDGEAVPS